MTRPDDQAETACQPDESPTRHDLAWSDVVQDDGDEVLDSTELPQVLEPERNPWIWALATVMLAVGVIAASVVGVEGWDAVSRHRTQHHHAIEPTPPTAAPLPPTVTVAPPTVTVAPPTPRQKLYADVAASGVYSTNGDPDGIWKDALKVCALAPTESVARLDADTAAGTGLSPSLAHVFVSIAERDVCPGVPNDH